MGEKTLPTLGERIFAMARGVARSNYVPTETNLETMAIVKKQMKEMSARAGALEERANGLVAALRAAGAPPLED